MLAHLTRWLHSLGVEPSIYLTVLIALGLILLLSIIIHFLLHTVVLGSIKYYHARSPHFWSQMLIEHKLFSRLSFTLQGVIISMQASLWLAPDTKAYEVIKVCAQTWILIYALLSFFALCDILFSWSRKTSIGRDLPLRGIFQSIKLIASVFVLILVISLFIDRSPTLLLSGLGAMTAVLMLVFKDPILGLVAGIQLSVNNMLQIGDWLEMPKYNADGAVIDVGLTTVKVSNWDNTVTTIPTYALISDSFKNWRAMTESGGRRIKRSINIDTTSIHFLSDDELEKLKKAALLGSYLEHTEEEIQHYNQQKDVDLSTPVNGRRMTNIGTFRAYLVAYLQEHPKIHKQMTLMVRQLAPTPEGLPIEIYAFTNTTAWGEYEAVQSDIFDHIFAVIPEFDLRIHQTPTGNDVRFAADILSKNHSEMATK